MVIVHVSSKLALILHAIEKATCVILLCSIRFELWKGLVTTPGFESDALTPLRDN